MSSSKYVGRVDPI